MISGVITMPFISILSFDALSGPSIVFIFILAHSYVYLYHLAYLSIRCYCYVFIDVWMPRDNCQMTNDELNQIYNIQSIKILS